MPTIVAGRYQLVREIGSGGMGRVFQALDTQSGKTVAAKILIAGKQVDLQALARFANEGAVLAAFKHPNIVQVYGTHLEEDLSCIIMEFLEGQTLTQILHTEQLPLVRIKHLILQVASALVIAHDRGVIHRDVKPDNIMVVGNDHVKVTDFGIARIVQEGTTFATLTSTGASIGTPLYMSPEQIEGQKVDGRSDIYSFGAVLYQMVAGRPPFEGRDPMTVAFKHVHKAPQPPGDINPGIPGEWEALILTCLAKTPDRRFQTAAALEAAVASLDVAGQAAPRRTQSQHEGDVHEMRTTALDQEARTLLERGKTKELSGDLQGAWRDYSAALTVASPGPLQAELEAAVKWVTIKLSHAGGSTAPRQWVRHEGLSQETSRTVREKPALLLDWRFQAGGAALLALVALALFLAIRQAQSTGTIHARASATAVPTTSTVSVAMAADNQSPRTLYGPVANELVDANPPQIPSDPASDLQLRDFAAQVRFYNPADASKHSFDYGLLFRETNANKEYRLSVRPNKHWYLEYGPNQAAVPKGTVSNLRVDSHGYNDLRLVVAGQTGSFYVNGRFVANLDVSRHTSKGSVEVGMDFFQEDEIKGRSIRYDNFTVWSSKPFYGPKSGILHHAAGSKIIYSSAGVNLRNFVSDTRFYNPYAGSEHAWDYGLMFRDSGSNKEYRFLVNSTPGWEFHYGTSSALGHGSLNWLNSGANEYNDLRLIAKSKKAFVFVNGRYTTTLVLSRNLKRGDVDVATGLDTGDQVKGRSTRYENFVIWSVGG